LNEASAESVARLLRYRWNIYIVQLLCIALVIFQFVVPATIGEQLAGLWRLDAATLGLLGSVLFYTYAVLQIPSGYLSDTWGPRRTITLAMLVMSAGQFVFSLAPGLALGLAGRALTGLGGALVLIGILKTVVVWFRVREFATLVGLTNLAAYSGAMLATAPLAYAAVRLGWRIPLLAVAFVTLAVALLHWLLVRDDPRELGLPTIGEIDLESITNSNADAERPRIREAIQAWAKTPSWVITIAVLLSYGSIQALQTLWAGPYLIHVHEYGPVTLGTSLLLLAFGAGVGPLVAGYLSDKVTKSRKPLFIAGAIGVLAGWIWILVTTNGASRLSINVAFLLLSFFGGFLLIGQTMIKEYVRPEVFGIVFGIYNMSVFVANAVFQLLMGWLLNISGATTVGGSLIYSSAGYRLAFVLPVAACTIGLILVFLIPETLKRKSATTIR